MKNQAGGPLVLSPELWVGVSVERHEGFNEQLKQMVSTKAWDPQSKTWWFPISYLPHVKQLMRECKLVDDVTLDRYYGLIQSELDRRRSLKVNTSVDGVVNPALADAYAKLGLHPSCSRTLVDWAIALARRDGMSLGAPTTELLHKEEAYRIICSGGA